MPGTTDYDAIVVGSGPNGLAAAIALQQKGLSVLVVEAKDSIGGGLRSAALTLPGFTHDICSAIHPMTAASPFFSTLPLQQFGLQYLHPALPAAHPFDGGKAAVLARSLPETAAALGIDAAAYTRLMQPIVNDWPVLVDDLLAPLHIPRHPLAMASFGLKAVSSALQLSKRFTTEAAKGLFAGMAAHAIQPLSNLTSSAIGLVLLAAGHRGGWPIPTANCSCAGRLFYQYWRYHSNRPVCEKPAKSAFGKSYPV
jgi:phytoene dehydrogenase-like protein